MDILRRFENFFVMTFSLSHERSPSCWQNKKNGVARFWWWQI